MPAKSANKPPRVYLDSLVFLNVVLREPGFWPNSLKVLRAVERGDVTLVTSSILHAELCGWTGKVSDNQAHQNALLAYLDRPDVEVIELDMIVVKEARQLAARHHLKGRDAVHLASALRMRVDHLFTHDGQMLKVGRKYPPLAVERPTMVWTPTFDDTEIEEHAAAEEAATKAAAAAATKAADAPPKMMKRPLPQKQAAPERRSANAAAK